MTTRRTDIGGYRKTDDGLGHQEAAKLRNPAHAQTRPFAPKSANKSAVPEKSQTVKEAVAEDAGGEKREDSAGPTV